MELSYTITGQEARIDLVSDPEAAVTLPEELDGYPVTELGAYALSKSEVEEVRLPSGVKKIGAYAFYGCQKLRRIYCHGRALDLGAGLFAGAGSVGFLDITESEGEKSCFKDMLSELRQTLRVRVHRKWENTEARLIFPEYYEESVENTPARILFVETHGCGHRYRYCFAGRDFQYRGYDELFPHVKVQEPEALVTELALGRLLFPCGLTEPFKQMYREYVREHWKMAGKLLIDADGGCWERNVPTNLDAGCLPWLVTEVLSDTTAVPGQQMAEQPTAEQQITALIALAQQAGDTEMVSWLMNYRHGLKPERRRRFEL